MQDPATVENTTLAGGSAHPLRQGVARAALASGVAEAVNRMLTIVLSIATARALLPSQVGVLGLAVIVVGIVSLIAACSETAGVVGRYEGTDSQHALAATLIRGFILTILITLTYPGLPILSGAVASAEGGNRELIGLFRVLLWLPVVELVAAFPRVLLQRRLDLTYLAGVGLFQVTFHVGLSVILLWKGFGAVGVAWSSIIAAAISAVAMWLRLFGDRWPGWEGFPDRKLRLNLLAETSKVFTGSFLGYLNGRVDNLLVAGALGPTAMSYYGMAWSASRVAPQILGQALGFVLVPALAKIQRDEKRVGQALDESLRHSCLLLAPVAAYLLVSGPSVVTVLLGSKWLPMVPCLQVMCITMLAGPLITGSNALLVSTGRAHAAGLATASQLITMAVVIIPMSRKWGIVGAAWADVLGGVILAAVLLRLTPIFRKLVIGGFRTAILVPIAAALITGLFAYFAVADVRPGIIKLFAQSGMLAVGYPLSLFFLGGKAAMSDLILLVRSVAGRSTSRPRFSPSRP